MKRRTKLILGFLVLGILIALFFVWPDNSAPKAAEMTRRELRQQGFKTDLSEFNLFTSDEMRAREAALTNATGTFRQTDLALSRRRNYLRQLLPDLMSPIGSDAAEVVSKEEIKFDTGEDYWKELRAKLDEDRAALDAACAAAISGPIKFHLDAGRGNDMLLPHLAALKTLQQTLGARVLLNLRDKNDRAAAWTNLLASTRITTAYEPEPLEISHLVRFKGAEIAFNIVWQALQVGGWSDDQLAALQAEWSAADFFKGIPETAAFARAGCVAECAFERKQPPATNGMSAAQLIRSPRTGFYEVQSRIRQARYREYGSFEDERDLLLYYRDREIELRRAIQAPTWAEMRQLPAADNPTPFQSRHPSSLQMRLNMRNLSLAFARQSSGFMAKAATAEARRRLILTAIALERYRLRAGQYPKTLHELYANSATLPTTAIDFMDGQPLRYRLTNDGKFVLYSTGSDCVDDGGTLTREKRKPSANTPMSITPEKDILWPRPATDEEVQAEDSRKQQEQQQLESRRRAFEAASEESP